MSVNKYNTFRFHVDLIGQTVIEEYESGASLSSLTRKYGIPLEDITKILTKHGKLLKPIAPRFLYKIQEDGLLVPIRFLNSLGLRRGDRVKLEIRREPLESGEIHLIIREVKIGE